MGYRASPSCYKVCTHLHTLTHTNRYIEIISSSLLSLIHILSVSLSQHFAPPSHYLLVKPMPELGEETKRHLEDYIWKDLSSRHHMYRGPQYDKHVCCTAVRVQEVECGRQDLSTSHTGRVHGLHGGMQIIVIINT